MPLGASVSMSPALIMCRRKLPLSTPLKEVQACLDKLQS